MTDTKTKLEISRSHKMLFQMIERKNLNLSIISGKYHVTSQYNDLLFIGSFENCFSWIESIEENNVPVSFLQSIRLNEYEPTEENIYFTSSIILSIIACTFFAIGFFSNPILGFIGLPAWLTAFYYFHKHKQQTKKTNEN